MAMLDGGYGGFGGAYGTRAHEVKALVETAVECGYEKNTELFDRMVETAYGDDKHNEFLLKFSEMMATLMKSNNKESEEN